MKRVLLVVAILATAFSCKKDKNDAEAKFCYTCTLTQTVDGAPTDLSTTLEQCELTETQKNAFEKSGSSSVTMGGIITKMTMKCVKK